ncbi:MAG: hypothetical protein R3F17_10870 [Planctomycetota bacterium]
MSRRLSIGVGIGLVLLAGYFGRNRGGQGLTPTIGSLVASWNWTRFHQSVGRGDWQEAYVFAEEALAWDRRSPRGWITLADHWTFTRASSNVEPDPERRVAAIVRGLRVLEAGANAGADPGALHLAAGQVLAFWVTELVGQEEDPLPWPGGAEAAWREGIEQLRMARDLGQPAAANQLQWAHDLGHRLGWTQETHEPGEDAH